MAFITCFESVAAGLRVRIESAAGETAAAPEFGVLLDALYLGEVTAKASRRGGMEAEVPLPPNVFGAALDLIDLSTGLSILPQPHALDSFYGFEPGVFAVADGMVSGEFSVRGLDPRVLVDFSGDGHVLARGLAVRRDGDGCRYRFRLPMTSTLKPLASVFLLPRIAGRTLPQAGFWVAAAQCGFIGFVDLVEAGRIAGWAMHLGRPAERVAVDLIIDGAVADTVMADQPRHDLQAAGFGDGHSAFAFTVRAAPGFRASKTVSVVISGTRLQLQGSPAEAPPPPAIRGSFDRLQGMAAYGWIIDDLDPQTPVLVEAVCEGRVLAAGVAKLSRRDLRDAGVNGGSCAFKIDIGSQLLPLFGKAVSVQVAGTGTILAGSPRFPTQNPNLSRYLRPNRGVRAATLPRLKRALNHRVGPLDVTIVMLVRDTSRQWLADTVNSVLAQWCDRWQLLCVDEGATPAHVADALRDFGQRDRRIRVLRSEGGPTGFNAGLAAATGAYVTFLDQGDALEPDAVYHLLRTARLTGAGLIYSDEATTGQTLTAVHEVLARPAFSYDYYLSHRYFVHMLCVERMLAQRVERTLAQHVERTLAQQAGPTGAVVADAGFVLRVLETAPSVAHVPRVLYRWRCADAAERRAAPAASQQHLDRHRPGATIGDGVQVAWPAARGRVLIVIPTRDKIGLVQAAIASIERTSPGVPYRIVVIDHESREPGSRDDLARLAERHAVLPYAGPFNFSRMNNLAVASHGGGCGFVLFLNNDVEAIGDGWLDRMRRLANREEVGAVGALLLYPDRRVQHAGIVCGPGGAVEAAFKFVDAFEPGGGRNPGYNGSLMAVRDYSAVTGACLMMRTKLFQAIGGFDEQLAGNFNDVDLCLRLRQAGYKVLYDGGSVLTHHEGATRSEAKGARARDEKARLLEKHPAIFAAGDPFYNPNLADIDQDHALREDGGCKRFHHRVTPADPPRPALTPPPAKRRRAGALASASGRP